MYQFILIYKRPLRCSRDAAVTIYIVLKIAFVKFMVKLWFCYNRESIYLEIPIAVLNILSQYSTYGEIWVFAFSKYWRNTSGVVLQIYGMHIHHISHPSVITFYAFWKCNLITWFLNKGNIGIRWFDNVSSLQPKQLPKNKLSHSYLSSILATLLNTDSWETLSVVALTVKTKQSAKHFI